MPVPDVLKKTRTVLRQIDAEARENPQAAWEITIGLALIAAGVYTGLNFNENDMILLWPGVLLGLKGVVDYANQKYAEINRLARNLDDIRRMKQAGMSPPDDPEHLIEGNFKIKPK